MSEKRHVVHMPDDDGTPQPNVWGGDGDFSSVKAETIYEQAKSWPPDQKSAMLRWLRATETRAKIRKRYRNVAELARSVDPMYRITPAVKLMAESIERALQRPKTNLAINMPPQEGKTELCSVWTPIRALQLNPNRRIILVSYGSSLAAEQSHKCRDIIARHGTDVVDPMTHLTIDDKLGLKLAKNANRIDAWKVEGSIGGLVAAGIGSSITGRAADLILIDDPYKNMMEADSAAHRKKVEDWFSAVMLTRRSPDCSIIFIQTRWHPEDLAGKVLAAERELSRSEKTWRHINIPAIAEDDPMVPDALNRAPGEALISTRGRTKEEFLATRRQVGERVWYSLYQGSPRNPAGGLFERKWFQTRLEFPPLHPVASIIGIDPADSGEGDETGIIGGMLDQDGTVVLTEDWSGQMTSDQWARQAVLLALMMGAREIAMEAYTAANTYARVIKEAYRMMHLEAIAKHRTGALLTPTELRCLPVTPPFIVHPWRAEGKVDAVGRSALLRQEFETGRAKTVEFKMSVFEEQAADWQAGQHQPDRVAAALIAHYRLRQLGSGGPTFTSPLTGPRPDNPPPSWLTRRITDK